MGRALTKTSESKAVEHSVRQILERAAKNGVSDVHIEPGEQVVLVRYRRGSLLYVANKLPPRSAPALVRHLKSLAELDTRQTRAPQHGDATLRLDHQVYTATVATLPVLGGEKVTVHLRGRTATPRGLESLGLWGKSLSTLQRALAEERGLLLIAGQQSRPVQTTLAAMLQKLGAASRKLAFIDPGDTPPGITPIIGQNHGQLLQLASGQGYDVIALGMVADRETARQIDELARSKHKLLARLSAAGAVQGLALWQQLHGQPSTLRPTAVGQINVRGLCHYCHEPCEPSIIEQIELAEIFHTDDDGTMRQLHELERLAADGGLGGDAPLGSSERAIHQLWRANPHGCKHCDHTGFAADIGIFEAYKPSDHFYTRLIAGEPLTALQQIAIKEGMISLKVDALTKALCGLIDFQTVLNVAATA